MVILLLQNTEFVFSLAAMVLLSAVVGALLFRAARRRRETRRLRAAVEKDQKSRLRNYRKAAAAYTKARAKVERSGLLIEIIHDFDDVSFDRKRGDRVPAAISYDEVFEITDRLNDVAKDKPDIFLVLHTLGGDSLSSLMLAHAISTYPGQIYAFVPYVAMSGGTMAALACYEVWMQPVARLGPIDATITGFSTHTWRKLLAEKPGAAVQDLSFLLGVEAQTYEAGFAAELNNVARGESHREAARKLASGQYSHHYPVSFDVAKSIGINVVSVDSLGSHRVRAAKEVANLLRQIVRHRIEMIRNQAPAVDPATEIESADGDEKPAKLLARRAPEKLSLDRDIGVRQFQP